jgi:ferredoxin-NADP reductase
MSARIIMKMRVERAALQTPDVLHLTVFHPRRAALPEWTPGAHVDLRLPDGRIRQYSLCGDPRDRSTYEIAIKREEEGRGGSRWAHENLSPGADAHVSAPRNNFPLANAARRHVLVAGGIGITPMVSMARHLAANRADFVLHYCTRSRAAAPFIKELEAIGGDRLRCWHSSAGNRFDPAVLGPAEEGAHVYACGPQRLVDAVQTALRERSWPDAQVHIEHFVPIRDENFKAEPFEARIASTGAILHVPADRSLLAVLRDNGFAMPSSCELGVCGSCECGYRDGIVIHRDVVLPVGKRQDRMTPCVSRARAGVTLEL